LSKLQQQLAQHAPHAQLICSKLNRQDMQRQLTTNQIDVALDVSLPMKQPINHLTLSSDSFCILMSASHPLARHCAISDYLAAKHIAVSNRASGSVVEDISLLQQGINRNVTIRCQSYQAAKAVIKDTDYLLTVPSLIAKQLLEPDLVIMPLPVELLPISTHLYWHQDSEQDEALVWFREAIKQIFIA